MKMAKSSKLSTRVRHGVAPESRGALHLIPADGLPKVKRRPRGKPFPKNHTYGLATRFKPGQSGNPNGRPRCKEINRAARAHLAEVDPADPHGRTFAEEYVDVLSGLALSGNISAISLLADRAEGKPATSLTVDQGQDSFAILIASMKERSAEIGLAEGRQRQLTQGGANGSNEETTAS